MTSTATLHLGDCREILPTIPAASVDCVITDPPYPEISRDYGRMTEADWHAMMDVVVPECRRILKPTGSAVFVLQPNSERVGRMRPWLWEFMAKWTREWGMVQDAWWWNITALPTVHCHRDKGLMRPSLKATVWLGDPDCYRNQDAVLWEAHYQAIPASKEGKALSYRASGYAMRDGRAYAAATERGGTTPFNVLPARSVGNGTGHGASTPFPVVDWWLRYICPPAGTVFDPFVGSGTVPLAALKRGCNAIGIERMPKYHATAERRIESELAARDEMLIPA